MTDDGIRMDPHYSADELEVITVRELKDRVRMLRTARAQQVAHELWRQAELVFTSTNPWPKRFLRNEECTLHGLCGPLGRGLLLEMLVKLRKTNFQRLIDNIAQTEGSTPLTIGVKPKLRKGRHITIDTADFMHSQLESIMAGRPQTPFHVQRNLVCALFAVALGFGLYSARWWLLEQFGHAVWTVPALLLALGISYGIWYRLTYWVLAKMRILALYMAFTDQFLEQ
ncbi:MAG: hypothetical protein H7A35_14275 [Planctomycetales bacterium]|nr:hypothetical protein [bacterium]UNM08003.1 MAG: hypothetical protein H7A35_14275 [Planctomycetales bacterium]